jgi:site-specific DNA-methyltransferase (adenine-specific)
MKPYYEEPGIAIYHCNAMDFLFDNPREKVDLLLTDPPYGLGNRMKGGTWGNKSKYADLRKWDQLQPALLSEAINRSYHQIIWGGNYYTLPPSRCWLVWDKKNAVPTMADCELAWTNFNMPIKRFSWPVGVHFNGHPTEKPVELFQWCIQLWPKTSLILDPFLGSGTTLRAAKELGYKAIGIEIEEKYCEIAVKRLAQEVLF